MSKFIVSNAAKKDLKNIGAYTQKVWGSKQRKIYIKNLDSAFKFLADNPSAGTTCDYIVEGLRKHRYESHTIFYEKLEDHILIVRILHKSMDVESNL